MRKNKSIAFRAGGALLIAALTPQVAQGQEEAGRTADDNGGTQRGVWYSGYDPARGEHYLYSGATVALNGDLDRDGFHARVFGSWVAYDLNPGSGRGYQGDFMLGYRMTRGNIDGGLYIGVDYQHYNPHPDDPTDEVRGTEWGFKIAADVETLRNESPIYFSVAGEYSTSFQTYWARARIGRTLKGFIFGPEGVALGNVGFDAQRIGGFFICDWKALPLMSPIEVTHRDLDEDAAEVVDQCACGLRATSRSMTRAAIRRRHWILRRLWRKANSSGYSTASTRGSVLSADGHVKRWAIHISNSRTAPSHGPFATSMRPAMRLPHKNLLCSLAGIRSFPPKAQV